MLIPADRIGGNPMNKKDGLGGLGVMILLDYILVESSMCSLAHAAPTVLVYM